MEENGAFELVRCFTLVEASLTTSAESRPQIPFDHEEGAVRFGLFYHCFHDGLCLQELVPANLAIKHFNSIGTCVIRCHQRAHVSRNNRSALTVSFRVSMWRCFCLAVACENSLPISLMNMVTASSVSFWPVLIICATIVAHLRPALKSDANHAHHQAEACVCRSSASFESLIKSAKEALVA